MAVLAHFFEIALKPNHPLYYFSILWKTKWIQSLDIILEGAEQAREAIAKQSARPPLVNVGSFTKRSEVKRRATLTNKYPN